jgi:hypothetical protein
MINRAEMSDNAGEGKMNSEMQENYCGESGRLMNSLRFQTNDRCNTIVPSAQIILDLVAKSSLAWYGN